jgi:membrane protease YdiL (CAAX protease family)
MENQPRPQDQTQDQDQSQAPAPAPAQPDAGSRRSGLIALLVLVPLLTAVVALQQLSVRAASRAGPDTLEVVSAPPISDGFTLVSKLMFKTGAGLEQLSPGSELAGMFYDNIDAAALSPSERVRAAMLAEAMADPKRARQAWAQARASIDSARDRFADLGRPQVPALDILSADVELMASALDGSAPSAADRAGLEERHGWFARVGLWSLADESERAALRAGGVGLIVLLIGGLVGGVLALLVGMTLLVLLLAAASSGRLRRLFVRPARGGSVYLETFVVFVGAFLGLQLLNELVGQVVPAESAQVAGLGLQWLLVPVAAWPLVRGVPWNRWRSQVGLVAPRGVLREVGAGVVGYLAGLPLLGVAVAATGVVIVLRGMMQGGGVETGEPVLGPSGPSNPVFELAAGAGPLERVLLVSLVVVWAPVVEELVLRGSLYRHLRGRLGWVVSAGVSALLFGVLHQYDALLLLPVITLGGVFAGVREWRGSLIGCMTGHALHNGTVIGLVLLVQSLMG